MSGFGPPPGAPVEQPRRRPAAYLPPVGLRSRPDAGMPAAASLVRGGDRPLLVTSHKPGIISLRPMSVGDLLDGAVKHLRRNPGPVFGATLVVLTVAAVPALLVGALAARGAWFTAVGADVVVDENAFFALLLGFGTGFASLVLTGALSYSVGEAALGRRPGLPELWAATRHRLRPLLALAGLLTLALALPAVLLVLLVAAAAQGGPGQADTVLPAVLLAVVGSLALAAWSAFVLTRTCLAGCAAVLEQRRALPALRRSWALTGAASWRTLVRLLVVGLLSLLVFWVVQLPLLLAWSLVQSVLALSPSLDAVWSSLGLAVSSLLAMAVVVPFAAGAISLVYVDQRMRREGFDLVLQRAARHGSGGG